MVIVVYIVNYKAVAITSDSILSTGSAANFLEMFVIAYGTVENENRINIAHSYHHWVDYYCIAIRTQSGMHSYKCCFYSSIRTTFRQLDKP